MRKKNTTNVYSQLGRRKTLKSCRSEGGPYLPPGFWKF